jgi:hypothetical protein
MYKRQLEQHCKPFPPCRFSFFLPLAPLTLALFPPHVGLPNQSNANAPSCHRRNRGKVDQMMIKDHTGCGTRTACTQRSRRGPKNPPLPNLFSSAPHHTVVIGNEDCSHLPVSSLNMRAVTDRFEYGSTLVGCRRMYRYVAGRRTRSNHLLDIVVHFLAIYKNDDQHSENGIIVTLALARRCDGAPSLICWGVWFFGVPPSAGLLSLLFWFFCSIIPSFMSASHRNISSLVVGTMNVSFQAPVIWSSDRPQL